MSSDKHLATYLNDHLAGSVGALELIEYLKKSHAGTELATFYANLYEEVSGDQQVLRDFMESRGIGESNVRQAGAWMAEKLGRIKLGTSEHDVHALETLLIGITGKRLLWRALDAANASGANWKELEARALEQFEKVEALRLDMARQAFGQ